MNEKYQWRAIQSTDTYLPMLELKKEGMENNIAVLRVRKTGAELLREGWTFWREIP